MKKWDLLTPISDNCPCENSKKCKVIEVIRVKKEKNKMLYHETVNDLLYAWDNGQSIWSVTLGGLGPRYEQAIQIVAIEFARAGKDYVPTGDDKKDNKAWDTICTEVCKKIDAPLGGLTGTQYSQAAWLAWQWCHNGGPAALMKRYKENGKDDSAIQVSKDWPKV